MTDRLEKIDLSDIKSRKVDENVLNELRDLFEKADEQKERYDFTWNGKAKAYFEAASPSTKTLNPDENESVDFKNSENLFITGDNLETLKLMQESYLGKVDMIYLDPPYNTGNDFIYNDNFQQTIKDNDYNEGNIDEEGNRLIKNDKTNGKYHSNWLSMMYPRLRLAHNLLSDSGTIFVSIDDSEQANLKLLMDEIFGGDNFVSQFIWVKTETPPSLSKKMRSTTEYILVYEKEGNNHKYFGSFLDNCTVPLINTSNSEIKIEIPSGIVKFGFIENGIVKAGKYKKIELINDIDVENGVNKNTVTFIGNSRWTQKKVNEEIEKGTFFTFLTKAMSPRFQRVHDDSSFKTPNTALYKEVGVDTNEDAVKHLSDIDMEGLFDYPKSVSLIKYLINMVTYDKPNALICDFFAGSGTTADAVMTLNNEDGGNRKFIVNTLDEKINEKSKAYGFGYRTIDQIARERIRKSADYIGDKSGFRTLELSKTNINEDVFKKATDLEQGQLMMDIDNNLDNCSDYQLLYDVLISSALEYNRPISIDNLDDKKIIKYDYFGELSGLVAYFGDDLSDDLIHKITSLKPLIAVFKESTFEKSSQKVNLLEQFRITSHDTKVKVI